MTKQSLVDSLKNRDEGALTKFYNAYRDEFVSWASKKFNCSDDDALEVYQQSMVILYENVCSGKLDSIESKSKTYLFAIGKNKLFEKVRRDGKINSLDQNHMDVAVEYEDEKFSYREEQLQHVEEAMKKLGEPCREILVKYYYQKNSMDDIADKMDYKNAATVKNIKYKCIQRLKKLLKVEKVK